MFLFWGSFWFFREDWNLAVLPYRGGIHGHKFTPMLFPELVQIECSGCWKIILSYFWYSNSPFVLLIAVVKQKRTTEMSFVSSISIGPSHPISEIVTSHIYRLKKTRIRNEGDRKLCVFFNQERVKWLISCHSEVYRRSWNVLKIGPSHPFLWYFYYNLDDATRSFISCCFMFNQHR